MHKLIYLAILFAVFVILYLVHKFGIAAVKQDAENDLTVAEADAKADLAKAEAVAKDDIAKVKAKL